MCKAARLLRRVYFPNMLPIECRLTVRGLSEVDRPNKVLFLSIQVRRPAAIKYGLRVHKTVIRTDNPYNTANLYKQHQRPQK